MSSVTLSPRSYPATHLDDGTKPSPRSRSNRNHSGRIRLIRSFNSNPMSPEPTEATVSARTRSRASQSPDKSAAGSQNTSVNGDPPRPSVPLVTLPHTSISRDTSSASRYGVKQEDTFNGDERDGMDEGYHSDVASEVPSVAVSTDEAPRTYKIKLSFRGTKRKVEDEDSGSITVKLDEDADNVLPSFAPPSPSGSADLRSEPKEEAEDVVVDGAGDEAVAGVTEGNQTTTKGGEGTGGAKRAPRKKRKWLKKGEVDPDDVVAVARQEERHKLIDLALANLDEQYNAVKNNTHASLVMLQEDLAARLERLKVQLEERKKYALEELTHMRDHSVAQTRFEFSDRREALVNEMNDEDRRRKSVIKYENSLSKVIDNTYPVSRDGRGGGGWQFWPSDSLSKHTEKLVPSGRDFSGVRRDIQLRPQPMDKKAAYSDYKKMIFPPDMRSSSSSSHHKHTSRSNSHSGSRTPRKDRPLTLAEVLHKHPVEHPHIKAIEESSKQATNRTKSSQGTKLVPTPYRPVPHPSLAQKKVEPVVGSSRPLFYDAMKGDSRYLSWEDYRALAKYDAWGCPLPHDRQRRDLVLRESWEKMQGRMHRESLQNPSRMIPLEHSTQPRNSDASSRA